MPKKNNRYRPAYTKLSFNAAFGGDDRIVAFVDCETEGLDPTTHNIVQFSAIKCLYSDYALTEKSKFSQYINPGRPMNPDVVKKTGITDELLSKADDETQVFPAIAAFMDDVDVFVAYNEPFDFGFVQAMYSRHGMIFAPAYRFDVLQMACDIYTIYTCPGNRTLATVAKKAGVHFSSENLHNSTEDVRILKAVFQTLLPDYIDYPNPKNQTSFPIPIIRASWEWQNPKNPIMKRVYFQTSCGKIFYEVFDHSFGCDQKEKAYSVDELNMEAFIDKAVQTEIMKKYRV